jgi:hypothetical protein
MVGDSVTNSALSRKLGGEAKASSTRIRAWREGTWKRPRPETCFRVGEALRAAGVQWSNGGIALAAAGYLAEFVALLIALSEDSIEGDFLAMVLASTCAVVAMPADRAPDPAELQEEARERLSSLFAYYGDDISAVWANLTRSMLQQRRVLEHANSSLKAAFILAQQLSAEDDLREIQVYDALVRWIHPTEVLYPGFGTFAKSFLDALRDSISYYRLNYSHTKRSPGRLEQRSKAWQRMWPFLVDLPYLANETEDNNICPTDD